MSGQTVVYTETIFVVTRPTGQSVTVAAHDVMVTISVEYTVDRVDVVISELKEEYVVGIITGEVVEDTIESTFELRDTMLLSDELPAATEEEEDIPDSTDETPSVAEEDTGVTAQSVVDIEMSLVVVCPVGQFVTVGSQDVTVYVLVE